MNGVTEDHHPARFPVQYVIRPQTTELHDYRGYAGKITSGVFRKGDAVTVYPSGETSTIEAIESAEKHYDQAISPMSVVLHLATDVDISRGDLIVRSNTQPISTQTVEAMLCWMDAKEFTVGNKYVLQVGTFRTRCSVRDITYQLNVNTYEETEGVDSLKLNDLAKIVLRTAQPVSFDPYATNRATGGAILIDETSNVTVGALMLIGEA